MSYPKNPIIVRKPCNKLLLSNLFCCKRKRYSKTLKWPSPSEVKDFLIKHRSWNQNGDDDHLLLGFDSDCLTDYLDAIGWPTSYTRSAADEERNGGKVTPGNEIGY